MWGKMSVSETGSSHHTAGQAPPPAVGLAISAPVAPPLDAAPVQEGADSAPCEKAEPRQSFCGMFTLETSPEFQGPGLEGCAAQQQDSKPWD